MDSDNATSAQPQSSQWGRLAEILGEVKTYIDVLEYSPKPSIETVATTLDVTEENALYQYQFNVLGAISTIKEVLQDMLDKQSGALLFTTGGSSVNPTPRRGNVGIAISGLRNYIFNLSSELKNKGIYVGHVSIGIWMQPKSGVQDKIANIWYDMYTQTAIDMIESNPTYRLSLQTHKMIGIK
jgi:short-subunit dehydrogenase